MQICKKEQFIQFGAAMKRKAITTVALVCGFLGSSYAQEYDDYSFGAEGNSGALKSARSNTGSHMGSQRMVDRLDRFRSAREEPSASRDMNYVINDRTGKKIYLDQNGQMREASPQQEARVGVGFHDQASKTSRFSSGSNAWDQRQAASSLSQQAGAWKQQAGQTAGAWKQQAGQTASDWRQQAGQTAGDWRQQGGQKAGEWNAQARQAGSDWNSQARQTAGDWNRKATEYQAGAQGAVAQYSNQASNAHRSVLDHRERFENSARGAHKQYGSYQSAHGYDNRERFENSATGMDQRERFENSATGLDHRERFENSTAGLDHRERYENSATGNDHTERLENRAGSQSRFASQYSQGSTQWGQQGHARETSQGDWNSAQESSQRSWGQANSAPVRQFSQDTGYSLDEKGAPANHAQGQQGQWGSSQEQQSAQFRSQARGFQNEMNGEGENPQMAERDFQSNRRQKLRSDLSRAYGEPQEKKRSGGFRFPNPFRGVSRMVGRIFGR